MNKTLGAALLTAAVAALAYLPVTSYSPVNLDEQQFFSDRWGQLRSGLSVRGAFSQSVFETGGTFYRPALTLSFMADAQRSGETFKPGVFYATNVLLHSVAAALACALLAALGFAPGLAAGAAILFALHPATAGATAWIPGRNDPLLFIFSAASLWLLTLAAIRGGAWLLAGHLLCFFAALLTKETAAGLLFLFPAWAWLAADKDKVQRGTAVAAGLGWAACLALYFYLRSGAISESAPFPGVGTLLSRAAAYLSYIFLPLDTPVYAWFSDIPPLRIWGISAAGLLLLGAGLLKARSALGALALLAALLFLLPGAFSDRFIPHRSYLPVFFASLALAAALAPLQKTRRAPVAAALGLLTFLFAVGSREAMARYSGPGPFWSASALASPSCSEADYELGYLAHQAGNAPEAEKRYLSALKKNPGAPDVRNNLGVLYRALGKPQEALRYYLEELALDPKSPQALGNIGNLLLSAGRFGEAAEYYKKRLAWDPYHEKTHELLIVSLRNSGKAAEAAKYEAALAAMRKS